MLISIISNTLIDAATCLRYAGIQCSSQFLSGSLRLAAAGARARSPPAPFELHGNMKRRRPRLNAGDVLQGDPMKNWVFPSQCGKTIASSPLK